MYLATAVLTVVSAPSPASAYERPGGDTDAVAVRPDGVQPLGASSSPAISGDGRLVAFQSFTGDLVPGTPNGLNVFVRDLQEATTSLVTISRDGSPAAPASEHPTIFDKQVSVAMSADGSMVAFTSRATNLVEGDANASRDVFVRNLVEGRTELVSVQPNGEAFDTSSVVTDISADGRFVAFQNSDGVFIRDRELEITERVDVNDAGQAANFFSYSPGISDDGRFVAFQSSASNLGARDAGEDIFASGAAIYLRDRVAETTIRVTEPQPATKANGYSWSPDISGDGRFIAFFSAATDLVPRDTNSADDVFVYDRVEEATTRVSVTSTGGEALGGRSYAPAISHDGRFVTFTSAASNIVPGDTNAATDVFVHDRLLGLTDRVSLSPTGAESSVGDGSDYAAISASGEYVTFESKARNFGTDMGGVRSVYRRTRGPALGIGSLEVTPRGAGAAIEGIALLAGTMLTEATDADAPSLAVPGADLGGASLALRRENEDLALRISLPGLPATHVGGIPGRLICSRGPCPPAVPASGVTYRAEFTLGGIAYLLTMTGGGSVVSRCEATCVPVSVGTAVLGSSGEELLATVPLSSLGMWSGASLQQVRVSSVLGEPVSGQGPVSVLDTVTLPPTTLPTGRVEAAITSVDGSPDDAAFGVVDIPDAGRFEAEVSGDDSSSDEIRMLWVRSCLGAACGPAVARVLPPCAVGPDCEDVEPTPTSTPSESPTPTPTPTESPVPETTEVAFTADSATSGQYTDDTLFEAQVTDSDGSPIEGAELVFELTGAESSRDFTSTTDKEGVARVTPTLEEKPGAHQLTVRFAGDDDHAGDADTVSFVVDKEDSALELTVHGEDNDKTLRARLSDLDTSSEGVGGRTIYFYSDGELIRSHQTDANGVASVALPPRHRGNNRTYEAVFDGDDFYLDSSDERAGKGKGGKGGNGGGDGSAQVDRSHRGAVLLL